MRAAPAPPGLVGPPGGAAATGQAPRRAAWPRGLGGPARAPRRRQRGAGVTDGGRGARRGLGSGRGEAGRRPRGSRTPEPGSIVVGAEGRGSETAYEARGAAPWSLSRRVPGEASALRPSRAGRAPCPGDEEAFAPPAQIAAAAGRLLHCLTTTRAGFSPRLPAPREGGGGDPGDSRRKEDTGDVAVVTAKRQLKILESVYRRLSEEFVEAWCPPETCKSKRYISLEDKRASSSRSKKETGVIPM
ncbi:Wilms tumor protein 1-interacting protein [Felis catus]|uniref:Wilms tumor protein 1-interacting protein n=1 Tax=Felis catus TaxID=9685 RepID=UPI001D1A0DFD|nr:Wilms tumor protein 1-interacting protein [Felis catus]